jgi:hypothetical protein
MTNKSINSIILKIWVDSKKEHLNFCKQNGICYTKESCEDQLSLIDQLDKLFRLDEVIDEFKVEKNF